MRREAALIFSPNGGSAEKAPPSADGSAPQARPSFSMRPRGRVFFFPKGKRPQPPILFSREKRTGRWSGPRENAPGTSMLNVLHEARMGPWTPPDWVRARRFTQPTPSKKKGLTGEHGSPVKSRRPAIRGRTAFPQKCRDFGGADRSRKRSLRKIPVPARGGNPSSPALWMDKVGAAPSWRRKHLPFFRRTQTFFRKN